MPGTFTEGLAELSEKVGFGVLQGQVEIDQVYAFNIHEGYWLNFMGRDGFKTLVQHTGEGHFLTTPLLALADHMLDQLADAALDGSLLATMAENMEELADAAALITPVEFGDLKESGHPTVTDDGALVYDRPPLVGRLSEAELDAKNRTRPNHGWGESDRSYLEERHPRKRSAVKPVPEVDNT